MANIILTVAMVVLLFLILFILVKWGHLNCTGSKPVGLFTFIAILFTSGLDMGLVILPLTEFPVYQKEAAYQFTNPLAVEFGFWGVIIWSFYFVTSFYFCLIEPKLQFFEKPWVKGINNFVIIGNCAFTAFLFLSNVAWYTPGMSSFWRYFLVLAIILAAVYSSTDIKYLTILSVGSTWLFFALIAGMWWASGSTLSELGGNVLELGGYFKNLHRFLVPISDHHAFYLFWWFAWSIMIGQFVSQFVGGLKTYQLLLALLVVPSIPLGLWFAVLYYYFEQGYELSFFWQGAMVLVGILFVVNSVDSLTRLYTDNLNWTVKKLGKAKYLVMNFLLLACLVFVFQFTPLKIQWIGLTVIALYGAVLGNILFKNRKVLDQVLGTKTGF